MKKFIPIIAIVLIFFLGIGILSYPLVSSVINNKEMRENAKIQVEQAQNMDKSRIDALFKEADDYNHKLIDTVIITDPFDEKAYEKIGAHYQDTFNVGEGGLIGYVEIPKIDVYLPIYHGTSQEVLAKGAGHLDNTSFPVGGPSTHSVVSAHSAFPTETFFDYLTDMEIGDDFYIHVLNRTLKYEVDQIKTVLPDNTKDLYVAEGKDYLTLLTCTPYTINTHRLLVRGKRVAYTPGDEENSASMVNADYIYFLGYRISYTTVIIVISAFVLLVIGTVLFIVLSHRRKPRAHADTGKGGDESG